MTLSMKVFLNFPPTSGQVNHTLLRARTLYFISKHLRDHGKCVSPRSNLGAESGEGRTRNLGPWTRSDPGSVTHLLWELGDYLNFVCPFVYVNGNNNNNLIQGCCATNRVSFPAWSVLSSTCCRVSVLWNDSSPWSAHLMSTFRHRGQARSVRNSGMRVSLVHWLSLNNDCFSTPLMLNAFRPKMYRANLF